MQKSAAAHLPVSPCLHRKRQVTFLNLLPKSGEQVRESVPLCIGP